MLNTDKTQATTQKLLPKQITVSNWHDYNLYPVFCQVMPNSFFLELMPILMSGSKIF